MNLIESMILRVTNPARFAIIHVASADVLLCVPMNELARDCAPITGTTQSFIFTDDIKSRILRECGTEDMGMCGAMFVSKDIKSFVPFPAAPAQVCHVL